MWSSAGVSRQIIAQQLWRIARPEMAVGLGPAGEMYRLFAQGMTVERNLDASSATAEG
jgi:hypothetical protein